MNREEVQLNSVIIIYVSAILTVLLGQPEIVSSPMGTTTVIRREGVWRMIGEELG